MRVLMVNSWNCFRNNCFRRPLFSVEKYTKAQVDSFFFFPFFVLSSHAAEELLCMDCTFWCGRCSEPALKGKKSINQLASSCACSNFQPRGGSN
jgi:hypothetical protein